MEDKNTENKYNPQEIEAKWQEKWESDKTFSMDMDRAENPFYNLMMFPYPSAEGLHVGNMYAFTGADVYAKFMRMQGKDVLEPIGLDGFGIHSENYAIKIGRHPKEQSKSAEKNFYRQLKSIGNSFDWDRTVETYSPDYYKWTQWLFTEMFRKGLAYRKTALVNWCPKDLTVLSDEQVIDGECERCSAKVEKRDLEQWFFRITSYADRLLDGLENIDWTEKVKTAQRNWIGKSEGAQIDFPVLEDRNFVLLHGYTGSVEANFFPWLKEKLSKVSTSVWAENLPHTNAPDVEKQAQFVLDNARFDENTVLLGHSLGAAVALKVVEKLKSPIKKLVLAAGFMQPGFTDHARPFEASFHWEFDSEAIKKNVEEIIILRASNDYAIPAERADYIKSQIGGTIIDFEAEDEHICGEIEPIVLDSLCARLKVFTTRPDTLFGATFMVIAPEHPLVEAMVHGKWSMANTDEVKKYVEEVAGKSDIERTHAASSGQAGSAEEKTGVDSGLFVLNPANMKKIPIWVADYVLAGYGTGAIMAVPAHDQRDFATAKKYGLPIVPVIQPKQPNEYNPTEEPYIGNGEIIGSDEWNGFHAPKDMGKVISWLEEKGIGLKKSNYHLRDWLISRQRYWGAPIPMIYCEDCAKRYKGQVENMPGWYAEKPENLPVLLPDVQNWRPEGTGSSPLASHPEFYETTCPECKGKARRETDVSDTFLDSSWYFLRYPSTDIENNAFDIERTRKWLPVNMYIGGAEHSVLHLLYSRFVTMVLKDLGLVEFDEPFTKFFAHGLIIKDGAKMSKSKGNVVVPDEYIRKYGADSLRAYLMFLGAYSDGGDFRDSGIDGMHKFLRKVWKLLSNVTASDSTAVFEDADRLKFMHKTIKRVTKDIGEFGYNTAIAGLMEWYNFLIKQLTIDKQQLTREETEVFLKLLAPFAPHMTEELWQQTQITDYRRQITESQKSEIGNQKSIHLEKWPEFEEKYLVSSTALIIVQVNGKKRGELTVDSSQLTVNKEIEEMGKEIAAKYLEGNEVKKTIYVKGKILNFVI